MTSQLSNSVIQEAYQRLADLLKLLQCSRRKQSPLSSKGALNIAAGKEVHYDSDGKSTEAGDTSNGESSDKSSLTDGSLEGRSRTRPTKPKRLDLSSALRPPPPPGLSAPPGLECEWNAAPLSQQPRKRTETVLNANAMSFVPASAPQQWLNSGAASFVPSNSAGAGFAPDVQSNSQQLRQSIRMLKGALEDWESNLPAPTPQVPLSAGDGHSLLTALAKLTPQEAATVRSLLDSKLETHSTAMTNQTFQTPGPRVQRPFTPFGQSRSDHQAKPPHMHIAKPTKIPQTPPSTAPDDSEESLRTQLRDLAEMDNACVLMVRKINRLGLNSAAPLKEYFSRFGAVARVMVAPTRSKAQFGQAKARVRPAPLGFVVMSKSDDANAILAHGAEHIVDGQTIGVFPFASHTIESKIESL